MGLPFLQSLAQVLTERMLNGVLESAVLAVLACLMLKAIGRKSSSTRFAVWSIVLVATVLLPVAGVTSWRAAAGAEATPRAAIVLPSSWAAYLLGIWCAGSVGLLGRVALGLGQIRRMRRNCELMDADSLASELRREISASCRRPVEFYVSRSLRVPMATGFFRPMIVVPAWVIDELSPEEFKVVLLHEAAHLRRRDDWTNLAQKVLRALFFFHPVVWWVEGRLALEREMACDDMVVAATSSPRAYAACLLALAEKSVGRRNLTFAQAAVHRVRHTSLRIREILSGNRPATIRISKAAMGVVMASAVACLVTVGQAPHLVAFRVRANQSRATVTPPVSSSSAAANALLNGASSSVPRIRAESRPARVGRVAPRAGEQVAARKADRFLHSAEEGAQVVPASLHVEDFGNHRGLHASTSETVFVVMRSDQIDAAGDRVLHISVYRMTVFYPSFDPGNPTTSKSI